MHKEYYVEISDMAIGGYIMQSQWFKSKRMAKNWAKKIDFIENVYAIDIMVADVDENGEYGDITIAEHIRG